MPAHEDMIYDMFCQSWFLIEILRKLTLSKKTVIFPRKKQFLSRIVIKTLLKPTSSLWKSMAEVAMAAILLQPLLKLTFSSFLVTRIYRLVYHY